jgi:phosphoglycolate phosphatase
VIADAVDAARILFRRSSNVIIDFDDTLVATYQVRALTLRRTAEKLGAHIEEGAIRRLWGRPFPELIDGLVPSVPFEDFIASYRLEMMKDRPVAERGADEFLKRCRADAKKVLVHSSSRTDLIEQDLEMLGWRHLVDDVFGIDRTRYPKPDRRSLDMALGWLRVHGQPTGLTTYIGDSPNDSILAKLSGLPFIGVLSGLTDDPDSYEPGSFVVQSLEQLINN